MGRTLNEVMAGLPKARRRAVEKRADELIAEELSLRRGERPKSGSDERNSKGESRHDMTY